MDSANQEDNDFTPFLNIINEFYVKDSKKVKASMKQKGESGEYLTTNPPYGYMKDPDNPKRHWIVDDEARSRCPSDFRMVYGRLRSLSDRQEAEGGKGGLPHCALDEDGAKCSCQYTR